MQPNGDTLTPKQEHAVLALLASPTLEAAARSAGVSPVTLWRWQRDPAFQEEYRAARRRMVEGALAALQHAAAEAVATLRRNLACGSPSVEVRAAVAVLDQTIKTSELMGLAERLERLEGQLDKLGRDEGPRPARLDPARFGMPPVEDDDGEDE